MTSRGDTTMGWGMDFWGKCAARGRSVLRGAVLGLLVAAVTACTTIYRNHGYVPSDPELAAVAIGDSRDAVAQKIGRPTAAGLLNDAGWFYVQSRFAYRGALEPKEIAREVVAISFTEAGTVSNIERFGLDAGKVVPLSRRITASNIKGLSVVRQLLGSFGRIGPAVLNGN